MAGPDESTNQGDQAVDVAEGGYEEALVEEVSIDGMCGVY